MKKLLLFAISLILASGIQFSKAATKLNPDIVAKVQLALKQAAATLNILSNEPVETFVNADVKCLLRAILGSIFEKNIIVKVKDPDTGETLTEKRDIFDILSQQQGMPTAAQIALGAVSANGPQVLKFLACPAKEAKELGVPAAA